ncbi:MAG: hypothetical protein LC121_23320 [Anaerolineae bacterium]|nr:hypothetical protein [Anaerolineae bacterium]
MTNNGNHNRGREAVILGTAHADQQILGGLSSLTAAQIEQVAVRAAVEHSSIDKTDIAELILGNVDGAGVGQALPGRSARRRAARRVGGVTINKGVQQRHESRDARLQHDPRRRRRSVRGGWRRKHEPRAVPRRYAPHGA